MTEKYFSIPLGNNPVLMEVQQYLRSKLPENTQWQTPETFHITLVYITDDMGKDAGAITPPALPAFGIGAWGLDYFNTPDGLAIHLAVERNPQLTALQTMLFYGVFWNGMALSDKSWPALWKPHITLATMPLPEEPLNLSMELPTPVHLQVESFNLSEGEYVEVANYPLMTTMPGQAEPIAEMARFSGDWISKELKGGHPKNVPHFPGVNLESLTEGDNDPQYLIIPVAEADVISANGVFYNEEFLAEIEKQMIAKRPIGNQGHIKDEDRDSIFPTPAGYWVGATRSGKTLWGKSYLPPNHPMREIVQRLKAVGGTIATSIYGTGERVWDKSRGAFVAIPSKFNLESIDFAPSERAGVGSLARVPVVVSEMMKQEDVKMPEKADIIKELTAGDIPQALKDAIVGESTAVKVLAEMRQQLGLGESADLGKVLAEMKAKQDKIEADAIENAIISEVKAQVMPSVTIETDGVKAVRGTIAELVRVRKPALGDVSKIVKEIAESEMAQGLYSSVVVKEMGGALGHSANQPGKSSNGMLSPESQKALAENKKA